MPVQTDHDPALDALPQAYFDWRQSTLGRITDELEERLLLDRIGPAHGTHVLDVGCGDAVLATRLALEGAKVTGLDTSTLTCPQNAKGPRFSVGTRQTLRWR